MKFITNIPGRIWLFLKESKLELGKTTWPRRKEVMQYTLAVVIASVVLATFLGGLDILFAWILERFVL